MDTDKIKRNIILEYEGIRILMPLKKDYITNTDKGVAFRKLWEGLNLPKKKMSTCLGITLSVDIVAYINKDNMRKAERLIEFFSEQVESDLENPFKYKYTYVYNNNYNLTHK